MSLLSVVSPVYNEAEGIQDFHNQLKEVLEETGLDYEVILVNDGSSDQTPALLEAIHQSDPRWKIIHLARNFGHQNAVTAGLDVAAGDAVVVMDSDLQDNPTAIHSFLERWQEGYQVVYGVRVKRKESLLKRIAYNLFYRILAAVVDVPIPLDAGDFSLMDQQVVAALRQLPERRRFVRGLRTWVGFRQIGIPIERQARQHGSPKYSLRKLLRLAMDGIFSFSWFPLRLMTLVGLLTVALSLLYMGIIVMLKLLHVFDLPGWSTVVCLLVGFGGLQLIATGLVGEYVGRMYDEVKRRPVYIVANQSSNLPAPAGVQMQLGDRPVEQPVNSLRSQHSSGPNPKQSQPGC